MSLFVDDDFVTVDHLMALDPEVLEIASAEGIATEGDGSVVRQAWDECADRLLEAIQTFGGELVETPGTITSGWFFSSSKPRVRLNQIVVSPQYGRRTSTLQRWMTYRALALFYRAAMNRRVSDRYETKYDRMMDESRRMWRSLFASGLPVVLNPLPCPGAVHEIHAGEFDSTAVTTIPGPGAPEGSYDVAITWVDGTAYVSPENKGNAESGPSRVLPIFVPADQLIQVSIAGLIPPGSAQYRGEATRKATGWNIYVGEAGSGRLYQQNVAPIPLTTTSYSVAGPPALGVPYLLDSGQRADFNLTFQNIVGRG